MRAPSIMQESHALNRGWHQNILTAEGTDTDRAQPGCSPGGSSPGGSKLVLVSSGRTQTLARIF